MEAILPNCISILAMVLAETGVAGNIPRNFEIVLYAEDGNEYNEWSKQLAERQIGSGQKIVYVKVNGPQTSSIKVA